MGVIGNPTPQDGEDLPEEFVGYGNQGHFLRFPPGNQAFIEHPALLVEPGSTEGRKEKELPQEGIPPFAQPGPFLPLPGLVYLGQDPESLRVPCHS